MRRILWAVADYMDMYQIDPDALIDAQPGSLEHLAKRILAFLQYGEQLP